MWTWRGRVTINNFAINDVNIDISENNDYVMNL